MVLSGLVRMRNSDYRNYCRAIGIMFLGLVYNHWGEPHINDKSIKARNIIIILYDIVSSTTCSSCACVRTEEVAHDFGTMLIQVMCACNQLKSLEIAFNNILRRIWKLPRNSHTGILHKVAHLDSIYNRLILLSDCFARKMCESKSSLLHNTFNLFYTSAFTPVGNNHFNSHKYRKIYFEEDIECAGFVRYLRLNRSTVSDLDAESMIRTICCDLINILYLHTLCAMKIPRGKTRTSIRASALTLAGAPTKSMSPSSKIAKRTAENHNFLKSAA